MSDRDLSRSSEPDLHVLPILDLKSRRGRRWLLRFAAGTAGLAAASPFLQACSPAPATPAAPATTAPAASANATPKPVQGAESLVPTPVPTKPVVATVKPAAAGEGIQLPVPREQTFIEARGNETITVPDSWNPFTPRGYEHYAIGWNSALNDMVLYHNVEATTAEEEWIGWLGEKFEYNKDYTSWTITVRKEAKWNDGTPFTSADIKFTMDLITKNSALGMRSYIQNVKSVDATDPQKCVINFTQPFPRYHYRFGAQVGALYVVAKHKWEGQDPQSYKNNPPVTTGPYKLKQVLIEQRQFIFERNDDYWGKSLFGLPKPKYVAYVTPPPADLAFEGFQKGHYDYGRSNLTYDVIKQLEDKNPGVLRAIPFLDTCVRAVNFNHAIAPTNKLEVRQGIAYLVDRKSAAANLWKPPSRVTSRPWNGGSRMLRWATQSLVDKYDAMYTYNPQKALEMFQKAGYTQQGGKLVDAQGKQMRIDCITSVVPTGPEHQLGLKLVDDLKKLGVDASFKFETGAPFTERQQKGEWNIRTMWQCGADPGDPGLMYQNYQSDQVVAMPGTPNTGTNDAYYKNPEFDKLAKELAGIHPDDPKAMPLYDQLYTMWWEDMISFPVMETIYTQVCYQQYWTNFPSLPKFYAHPADHHTTLLNIIRKLEPGPLGKAT